MLTWQIQCYVNNKKEKTHENGLKVFKKEINVIDYTPQGRTGIKGWKLQEYRGRLVMYI